MPTKSPAWVAKDGTLYATAEEAGRRDLFTVLSPTGGNTDEITAIVDLLIEHSDTVVEALTTTAKSRPSARKKPGTTNPRRATKAQAQAGFAAMRVAATNGVDGEPTPAEVA